MSEDEADISDAESESSTVVFDHEPFDSFSIKVAEFARNSWSLNSAEDVSTERMSGGGYNRIIGITLTRTNGTTRYVLRLPRFDAARMDRDTAALLFVKRLESLVPGSIPVPRIVAFDETSNNALQCPYMIQIRLSGMNLFSIYDELDNHEKLKVATELGRIYRLMFSAKKKSAGRIELSPASRALAVYTASTCTAPFIDADLELLLQAKVEPFFQYKPGMTATHPEQDTQTTCGMLIDNFTARKAQCLGHSPPDTFGADYLDRFIAMTLELESHGWFKDVSFSLCHLDLEARNVLVDQSAGSSGTVISGILDWDSAVLAPAFMACKPPQWLWSWTDDEDEDERTANDMPGTAEDQEIKSAFETAAGPNFARYAYRSVYRLARRLVRFAIDGTRRNEDIDDADAMLDEWEEIRG